jgi:hypothetical protein
MSERSVNMYETTRHIPQDIAPELLRASGFVDKLTDRLNQLCVAHFLCVFPSCTTDLEP